VTIIRVHIYRSVVDLKTLGEDDVVTEPDASHIDAVRHRGDDNEVATSSHDATAHLAA